MQRPQEGEELEEMDQRLRADGLPPAASADERQRGLWRLLQRSEGSLTSATQDLQILRTQQAAEMKEVENYVEHIRNLLEDRESLTAEYERENEQLRAELQQMRLQQDAQLKEVVEMLDQEGLADIGQSSPSEQVAYLLVERSTLLERLEAAERKVDTQSLTGSLREVHLQEELDHARRTMEEELRQQRETMQQTKEQPCPAQSPWKKLLRVCKAAQSAQTGSSANCEELSGERLERQRMERDLDEASRRLTMAHEEIRRLTDELDSARKTQSLCGPELERARQEVEQLRQEVDKLKECDIVDLQRAKEHNARLDQEIRVLRDRVRSIDTERKTLLQMVEGNDDLPLTASAAEDQEQIHKRCRLESEDKECRLRELQRRLQRQQEEQEELVERNEELESLLGEAQNRSKAEREHHECEVEGLHRKVRDLEAEVTKLSSQEPVVKRGDLSKESEYLQQLRSSSQERVALLECLLTEEKEWRKQLEVDLATAQAALKKDKEELHREREELRKLRVEFQNLQMDHQQKSSLNTCLTKVKCEKDILREKVAQLERAQNRLKCELDLRTSAGGRAQEDLRESRGQVSELSAQVGRLRSEVSSLEGERGTLREEVVEERVRVAELQRLLSEGAQEKRQLQGERERLGLELQRARGQQQRPPQHPDPQLSPAPADGSKDDDLNQLASLKLEMSRLHSNLEEERRLASQHQLALQAQISEAQARTKSQDSVLQQRADEFKQLRQDLQRTQSLFTSAERELRYEREKGLDLKRHNALLEQEKMKVCAELKQAQVKVAQLERSGVGQGAELERLQQRSRELELERTGQIRHTSSGLQEALSAERARVIATDRKVLELQQQLKNTLHQLHLEEARAGETNKLERETRDMSDSLSILRAQLQDEQLQRKLLEQRETELQQQVRSLRSKETTLNRANGELGHRLRELQTRQGVLESEREEQQLSRQACMEMQGRLASAQQESERLQEELQLVIQQLDTQIRKYNEKQAHHRMKLRKARQIFLKETAQRDGRIQKLENELALASSLSEKDQDRIKRVMEENEQLLLEQRDLLRRLNEAEELGSTSLSMASTVQHRVKFLEEENRFLEERTLQLASQVGALERALRKVQSVCSVEDLKKVFPSESLLNDGLLQTSNLSVMSGMCDTLGILDAIHRVKVGCHTEGPKSSSPAPPSQPSDIGYLNVTSPVALARPRRDLEENRSLGSDEV